MESQYNTLRYLRQAVGSAKSSRLGLAQLEEHLMAKFQQAGEDNIQSAIESAIAKYAGGLALADAAQLLEADLEGKVGTRVLVTETGGASGRVLFIVGPGSYPSVRRLVAVRYADGSTNFYREGEKSPVAFRPGPEAHPEPYQGSVGVEGLAQRHLSIAASRLNDACESESYGDYRRMSAICQEMELRLREEKKNRETPISPVEMHLEFG